MRNGFTLMELSIVLVIVGLLVGGVLVGQSLIRGAKINKVVSTRQQFDILINLFYERFRYMPGDFPSGYNVFGPSCGTNAVIDNGNSVGSCNGNGNGIVDYAHPGESYLVWAHLASAGFLTGTYYPGWAVAQGASMVPGYNSPKGPYSQSGWFFPGGTKNAYTIRIAGQQGFNGDQPYNGVMAPSDAHSIDVKLDDGFADTGIVTAEGNGANTVPDQSTNCLATYHLYSSHDNGTNCFLNIGRLLPF